ncbi:uncharacterized protein LOC129585517 [Paramacrobiotus metropolitanus]|uniref:uncharacterized protein LOC129585517 n=1 Tax=Paramacrobiotus metropolitanus TaxID=2943436 RepID=UPI00244658FD|nr:uncharacterized protein LOC129585517 [Paramacrobiotus metropolitanus]
MDLDCCLPGSESSDPELLIPRQEDPTSGNFPNVLALTQGTERGVTQWRLHERPYCAVCQLFLEEPCWLHAKSIPNGSVVPFALASLPNILCLDVCSNSSTVFVTDVHEEITSEALLTNKGGTRLRNSRKARTKQ